MVFATESSIYVGEQQVMRQRVTASLRYPCRRLNSNGVPESDLSLQNFLATCSLLVLSEEVDCIDDDNHNDKRIAGDRSVNTWTIAWSILRSEDLRLLACFLPVEI